MRRDIDKLADRLVELGSEGISIETKILEWKTAWKTEHAGQEVPEAKAS